MLDAAIGSLSPDQRELGLLLEAELLDAARLDIATRPVALARLEQVTEPADGTTLGECMMLANLASEAMAAGRRDEAIDLAERSLAGDRLLADEHLLTYGLAVNSLTVAGRLERAGQAWDDALAVARARGAVMDFALVSSFRTLVSFRRGAVAEAIADARAALDAFDQYEGALASLFATVFLCYALTVRGELDAAAEALGRHEAAIAIVGPFAGTMALESRGRVRLAQGQHEAALRDLLECGRRLEAWSTSNDGLAPWRAPAALAAHGLGDAAQADRLAGEAVARARASGAEWLLAEALRAAGLVAGGERGLALLEESVQVVAGSSARLELALSLTELGAALGRAGRRSEGRDTLRQGLDRADACGALAVAHRARDELVNLGAAPRRARMTGRDALTPSEARVAGLAAGGAATREIAQSLFVSTKTVETHLGRTYRKLGISSRAQLEQALAAKAHA